jgi:hypothetical protein
MHGIDAESTFKYSGNQYNIMLEVIFSRYEHFINNHMLTYATTNLSAVVNVD